MSKYQIDEIISQHRDKDIIIVGNGPTSQSYIPMEGNIVWTINNGFMRIPGVSLTFMMDDLHGPAWNAHRQKPEWIEALKNASCPVLTSYAHSEVETLVNYPVQDVVDTFGVAYFAESLSYMISFAIYCDVKSITFYGVDYYDDDRRSQRSCSEFWCGFAMAKGIDIVVHPQSYFMCLPPLDLVNRHVAGFYGYVPERFQYVRQQNPVIARGKEDVEGSDARVVR